MTDKITVWLFADCVVICTCRNTDAEIHSSETELQTYLNRSLNTIIFESKSANKFLIILQSLTIGSYTDVGKLIYSV